MWTASNGANNEKNPCDSAFIVLLAMIRGQNVQEEGLKHGGEEVCEHRVCPQSAGCIEQ